MANVEIDQNQIEKVEVTDEEIEHELGHLLEKSYDILLITNLLSEEINFKYLKNIFDYKNNENFLENTKFLVENDSYKIKFK